MMKAVIFDMDGLLVDSEPLWAICETDMLTARGKVRDEHRQKHLLGLRMDDFMRGWCELYDLGSPLEMVAPLRAEIVQMMVDRIPTQVVPRPGAPELLAYLAEQGIPCAIASSSAMVIIDTVVKSQGWEHYFKVKASGEEVPNGKPAPDVYLEAARRLGVNPADCLALEDSPNGSRAAVAAGMTCYAVPDLSHSRPEAFSQITPHVFESLHDVLGILK